MRGWKEFVAQSKFKRLRKQDEVSSIMEAIQFHEAHLTVKVVKGLMINQIQAKNIRQSEVVTSQKLNKKMVKFYWKIMLNKWQRKKRYRHMRGVAQDYHRSSRAKRLLLAWKSVITVQKQKVANLKSSMFEKPYSMEILLEHMCYGSVFKAMDSDGQQGVLKLVPDILKFNSFANLTLTKPADQKFVITENNKRKKVHGKVRLSQENVELFNSAVQQVLQYKQVRVIRSLRKNLESMKYFRYKRVMNFK
jgi:hypothetical protein